MINAPLFSVNKGDLPIEMSESLARFLGKLLQRISELNWSGQWAFWEWFWLATISVAIVFVLPALYKRLRA